MTNPLPPTNKLRKQLDPRTWLPVLLATPYKVIAMWPGFIKRSDFEELFGGGPNRPPLEIGRSVKEVNAKLDLVLGILKQMVKLETGMAIDTKALLDAVAKEVTENASLRTLVEGQSTAMKALSEQLAAAIASGDPAALAQVQADLDKATADLSTDSAATEAALAANTPPAA